MSNIKKSIVIVNEFTVPRSGGGTRGSTPGRYVTRYMARNGATEPIDKYISAYMARDSATEPMNSIGDGSSHPYDGVAFGDGNIALTAKQLKLKSDTIQDAFNNGKTVLKTVISFETKYLKEKGVLPPDFEMTGRGAAKHNVDQQKLRMAIMKGIARMSFDNPCYVGVIQLDTAHVHCHLAIADLGVGTLKPNGEQKGMISDKDKRKLRQGIECVLDEYQTSIQACADYETAEKLAIKSTLMHAFAEDGFTQAFIAALPNDKSIWRANTNRKDMRLANTLLYGFTKIVLSGTSVEESAKKYAEHLSQDKSEYQSIYSSYLDRMTKKCMNAVYTKLKHTKLDLQPATPFMASVITGDGCQLGASLRRYQSARIAHKNRAKIWNTTVETTDDDKIKELAETELRYHLQCMLKYVMLLPITEPMPDNIELLKAENAYYSTLAMGNDPAFLSLSEDEAETLGLNKYGVPNGSFVGTKYWGELIEHLKLNLTHATREHRIDCAFVGKKVDGTPINADHSKLRCLDLCDVDFVPTDDELAAYVSQTAYRRQKADDAKLIIDDIEKACDYIGRSGNGEFAEQITADKNIKHVQRQESDDGLGKDKEKPKMDVLTTPFSFSMDDIFKETIVNEISGVTGNFNK